MSVKHVKEYYNQVCDQYHEFLEELKDFGELCNDGMVAPEVVEQAQRMIEPLKDNWMKMNYIMWLLNKPNKKSKQDRYKKQNPQKDCITEKQVYEQNQKQINELNDFKKK